MCNKRRYASKSWEASYRNKIRRDASNYRRGASNSRFICKSREASNGKDTSNSRNIINSGMLATSGTLTTAGHR